MTLNVHSKDSIPTPKYTNPEPLRPVHRIIKLQDSGEITLLSIHAFPSNLLHTIIVLGINKISTDLYPLKLRCNLCTKQTILSF